MAMKICYYCGNFFLPDPRVGDRQKACSLVCQRFRKQENNRLYRKRDPGYWRNHYEDYVRPWRQRHPDYQRQWRKKRKGVGKGVRSAEIKAERIGKLIELTERILFNLREIKAEILLKPSWRASLIYQSS